MLQRVNQLIRLNEAVIVEGKYDKIKLENFIDAYIVTSGGFRIFKDTEKRELFKKLASDKGVIIMTDSDSAGMVIRNFIKNIVKDGKIVNVYLPQIAGKEKRKREISKEGFLGVEGLSEEIIIDALNRAGVFLTKENEKRKKEIDKAFLFELGLSGGSDSKKKREELYKFIGLPLCIQTNSFLEYVNRIYTKKEFEEVYKNCLNQQVNK